MAAHNQKGKLTVYYKILPTWFSISSDSELSFFAHLHSTPVHIQVHHKQKPDSTSHFLKMPCLFIHYLHHLFFYFSFLFYLWALNAFVPGKTLLFLQDPAQLFLPLVTFPTLWAFTARSSYLYLAQMEVGSLLYMPVAPVSCEFMSLFLFVTPNVGLAHSWIFSKALWNGWTM